MADGINSVNGYGNGYGNYGYYKKDKDQENGVEQEQTNQQQTLPEYEQIDPNKVMEFLTKNNFFVAPANVGNTEGEVQVDAQTKERIENSMANFERIYAVVANEFGEELAPIVMNSLWTT